MIRFCAAMLNPKEKPADVDAMAENFMESPT